MVKPKTLKTIKKKNNHDANMAFEPVLTLKVRATASGKGYYVSLWDENVLGIYVCFTFWFEDFNPFIAPHWSDIFVSFVLLRCHMFHVLYVNYLSILFPVFPCVQYNMNCIQKSSHSYALHAVSTLLINFLLHCLLKLAIRYLVSK